MTSRAGEERFATKEIRVGLAVIAVLALTLTWVVARRFLRTGSVPAAAIEGFPSQEADRAEPVAPADRQPMILHPSDRYLGPAAYVEPRTLAPVQTLDPAEAPPFDHRPSLLPTRPEADPPPRTAALPEVETLPSAAPGRGRIRDAPIWPGVGGQGAGDRERGSGDRGQHPTRADDLSLQPLSRYEKRDRPPTTVPTPDRPALTETVPTTVALAQKREPITLDKDDTTASRTTAIPTTSHRFASGLPEIVPINHADLQPGRRYLIEEGDTLQVIARFELGDAGRWTELLFLNRGRLKSWRDPLPPGTWLTLPAENDDSH